MARREGRQNGNIINDLGRLPWPLHAAMMVVTYFGITYIPPMLDAQSPLMRGLLAGAPTLAPVIAMLFLVAALISAVNSLTTGRSGPSDRMRGPSVHRARKPISPHGQEQLKQHEANLFMLSDSLSKARSGCPPEKPEVFSLELLRRIEWKRFEELCRAYLEAKGCRAEVSKVGPDGGIDIRLFKGESEKPVALVQCKAWNAYRVGVKPVRELFGVMAAEKIADGIFMATGSFTEEAKNFARENNLVLVSGDNLLKSILRMPEQAQQYLLAVATEGDYLTPTCPRCDTKLVLRTTSKSGNFFWGCSSYPKCQVTLGHKPDTA